MAQGDEAQTDAQKVTLFLTENPPKLLEKQQHEGEKTVLFLDIFICREGDISTPLFSFLMACFEVIHVEADRSDLTSAVAQRKKKKKIGSE